MIHNILTSSYYRIIADCIVHELDAVFKKLGGTVGDTFLGSPVLIVLHYINPTLNTPE